MNEKDLKHFHQAVFSALQKVIELFKEKEAQEEKNMWYIRHKATCNELNSLLTKIRESSFVLPEKWCVEVTDESVDLLFDWAGFKFERNNSIKYVSYRKLHSSGCLYTEITFDQFKKYVLKQTAQLCQNPNPYKRSYLSRLSKANDCRATGKIEIVMEEITTTPIPTSNQAIIFEDRVEIVDWNPNVMDEIFVVAILNTGEFIVYKDVYNGNHIHASAFKNGFIKRTESEAKLLVKKLKSATL